MRTPSRLRCLAAALGLAVIACAPSDAAPPKADFFVAPTGRDSWSGTLSAPNAARSDGPFATVARAQKAVRGRKRPGGRPAATVLVRGGFYPLSETLVFTPEDGGTRDAPVTYAAYPGETPVLSGGVRLGGFRRVSTNRWEVTIPEVAAGRWHFGQLYVNGGRRYRPRLPKSGYYFVAAEAPSTPEQAGKGFDRFRYRDGDLRADWTNRDDIEVLPFQVWTMSRFRIKALDESARVVTFTRGTRNAAGFSKMDAGKRYLVENVAEALSEPGEWYLDRKTGVLSYLPKQGEKPESVEVVAPRLERLLEVRGDPAKRQWVQGLVFRGLTFAHAAWQIPPDGNSYPQAEIGIGGALSVRGGRDVAFEKCVIRSVGGYGVEIADGSQRVRLAGCALYDLGAGGVKIGETRFVADEELATSHNAVTDCYLAYGGRLHPSAVGVWIGHSAHNTIDHNDIFDFYYTGISPGWSWGYGPSGAHHNRIANNHIHKIGQGILSDMGGIYTLGVSPGTVLEGNRIHDVQSFDYGGWGIYFDEGSTGIVARNNVAYNTKSAPFHQHYGTDNLVENNIFAFGREAQLMRTRADNNNQPEPDKRGALSFTLRRNVVLWKEGPLLGSNWSGDNFALERNLYWHAGGQPVRFVGGADLAAWQARGFDRGSAVADPLFVAPEKGDFRLKPGSPARQIGFRPIDTGAVGPRPGALAAFARPANV
ncbi:MAG TPA: right-handed parallel beta-helix repeat-containing protein, partial [Armatimonadaceae bacterium]|nr:right-handed parallel beta-helix repeat-containing protein [Armatimonadaceae bacterium]